MPELKLVANTSLAQLQAFQQAVGNKDEIRAKTNDDGTTTLYTHSRWKISLNRDPQKRAEKQQAAYTAVKDFLKDRLGNADTSRALVAKMESKVPLDKATLTNAINESKALFESYLRQPMSELLNNPAIRTAFKEFCAKEYASENIEFYEAVERFNTMVANSKVDVNDLKRKLTEIMDTYVTSIAPKQINVGYQQRTRLEEENRRIQNDPQVTRDAFRQVLAESRTEIEQLMVRDTWRRFTNSPDLSTIVKGMLKNLYPI